VRRRERVLQAVADLTAEHGHSPSYAEIGEAVGLVTRSAVLHHLRALRAEGLVTFSERRPRTVRLVEKAKT
jgi:SOS-response transcriptional repressor LexA